VLGKINSITSNAKHDIEDQELSYSRLSPYERQKRVRWSAVGAWQDPKRCQLTSECTRVDKRFEHWKG
jgi:hypothetical protein